MKRSMRQNLPPTLNEKPETLRMWHTNMRTEPRVHYRTSYVPTNQLVHLSDHNMRSPAAVKALDA
mgnify:CR=1 FL=1